VVKLIVVAISGVTAALHARARKPAWIAMYGALTGLPALAALFLGVLLAADTGGQQHGAAHPGRPAREPAHDGPSVAGSRRSAGHR
jgi:hypothetical protein